MAAVDQTVSAGQLTGQLPQWNSSGRALGVFRPRHGLWLEPTLSAPPERHGAADRPVGQWRPLRAPMTTKLFGLLGRCEALRSAIDPIAHDNLAR